MSGRSDSRSGSSLLTTSSLLSKPSSLLLSHGLSLGGGLGGLSSGDRKRKEAGLSGLGVKKTKEETQEPSKGLPSLGSHSLSLTSSLSGSLQGSTRSSLLSGTLTTKSSLTSSLTLRSSLLSSSLTSSSLLPSQTGLTSKPAEKVSKPKVKRETVILSSTLTPKPAKPEVVKPAAKSPVSGERVKDVQPRSRSKSSRKRVHEAAQAVEIGAPRKLMEIPAPEYKLEVEMEEEEEEEAVTTFTFSDLSHTEEASRVSYINALKRDFINAVCGSLIHQPNFTDPKDTAHVKLTALARKVMGYDPEFVLKVALYTRKKLNIRTTANFLLALGAQLASCRPYLKKYFSASIALPSDWLEVADIYQAFHDKSISVGALPSALRKAMKAKFPDFDKYQLAKYNKESSSKKKKKAAAANAGAGRGGRGRGRGAMRGAARGGRGRRGGFGYVAPDESSKKKARMDGDEEGEAGDSKEKKKFTLKQIIRKLHITEPVEHVMCLVGKKYPNTLEEFYRSKLPGMFEEEKAGKRMKLPVPETWETQVSLKGNKAATWETLIDHKKLPFMAMLRNLRNLIKAGISPKHHAWVLRKLTDQGAVINSKQFPFRFFSAYEVLSELEKDYEKNQAAIVAEASNPHKVAAPRYKVKSPAKNWWLKKQAKKKTQGTQEVPYEPRLLQRYKKALDTAVKIATVYNVQPIRGTTLILCNQTVQMDTPCTAAKGLGRPRTMKEVALLMGLMCKYSCEECQLVLQGDSMQGIVDLKPGTILDNMQTLLDADNWQNTVKTSPYVFLRNIIRDQVQLDNLIVLGMDPDPEIVGYADLIRHSVNPNLLYVNVSFLGTSCRFNQNEVPDQEKNVFISGYSDQILRFVAERNDGGQLQMVEKIDEAFKLKPLPTQGLAKPGSQEVNMEIEKPFNLAVQVPSWRSARVFISSTFRDMHGERDLLTRFVFPELRARSKKLFVNVFEVDLRWGVTEEESRSNRAVSLCLEEVGKCQLFVGILGERYGWVPDLSALPDTPEFDWVREYRAGASITELEMVLATLAKPTEAMEKAFFFFRNNDFEKDVPREVAWDFVAENEEAKGKMAKLKDRVRASGLEVYDGYPCTWGGVVDNKAMVAGLQDFGLRVLNNLWNAIQNLYQNDDEMLNEERHTEKLHEAFAENLQSQFIGRKELVKKCLAKLGAMKSGLLGLVGKSGSGKSALLACLSKQYMTSKHCKSEANVITHMVGAAPGSANLLPTLRRLADQISWRFGLNLSIPEDYKSIVSKLAEMLEMVDMMTASPLVIFLDGIDNMDPAHLPHTLDWLPQPLPKGVVVVLTLVEGSKSHQSLCRLKGDTIPIGPLDIMDKADVIRNALAHHRKTLDESPFNNQLKLLMSKKEAHNPLFLKLACEELRVFGVFEKISQKLKAMPHVMPALLQEILARLEADHGQDMVATSLSLLICVRDGLDAHELWELLGWHKLLSKTKFTPSDLLNLDLSPTSCLPPATFAYLQRSIQGFLNPTAAWSSRLRLAHTEIAVAVRQRYLRGTGADTEMTLHKLLAGYFWRLADPEKSGSFKSKHPRAFSELPYHLACCGCYKDLETVLCSLPFILVKARLHQAALLMDDFSAQVANTKFQQREESKFHSLPRVQQFKSFVARNLHILSVHPSLTLQQALNEPDASEPCQAAREMMESSGAGRLQYMECRNKLQEADPCYLTISNLPTPATCVSVTAEGNYFATGSKDCEVHLYNLQTGKEERTFHGHAGEVTDVCFVGKSILCSASADTTLSLWHVEDGHRLRVLMGHDRRVNACASNSAGHLVASASWDCKVKVWNPNSGETVATFNLDSPVNCVDFHPEGQLIVTGSWDSVLRIYDTFNKTRVAVLRGHTSSIRDVAYANTGRHIASCAMNGEVKLWSASNGSQVGNIEGHEGPINRLIFSPSGTNLITIGDDCKVKVWSGHLGMPVHSLDHAKNGPVVSIDISKDGKTVVAGFHGGDVKVICARTGSCLMETKVADSAVRAIKFSASGKQMLCGSSDGKIQLLDVSTGRRHGEVSKGHTQAVLSLAVNQKHFASTGEDCLCLLYNYPATSRDQKTMEPGATLMAHVAPVTAASFSPDGVQLATASRDGNVLVWNVVGCMLGNLSPVQTLHSCHSDWINDCQWSNIGGTLVTASNDFNLKVWDLKTSKSKFTLQGHQSAVNAVAYKYGCLASACSDGTVKVWSHKGTEITTLHGHTERVNACAMFVAATGSEEDKEEEEGPTDWAAETEAAEAAEKKEAQSKPSISLKNVVVATAGDDGAIWIWKPLLAREMACLMGHSDRVLGVGADKQGQVVSSALDRSLRLWHPVLSEAGEAGRHQATVTFTTVSPDGQVLVSGSRDGIFKIWLKSSDGKFEVVEDVQASDTAITCSCFYSGDSSSLAVGCNDGSVSLWTIVRKTKGVTVKAVTPGLKVNTEGCPVTGLTWTPALEKSSGSVLLCGDWVGGVSAWNVATRTRICKYTRGSNQQWPVHTSMSPDYRNLLVVCWNKCAPQVIDVAPVNSASPKLDDSDPLNTFVARHWQPEAWPTCATTALSDIITGDSQGNIKRFNPQGITSLKAHTSAVTALVNADPFFISTSDDCTVKLWDPQLKQVGQFFCKAPVTCMTLAGRQGSGCLDLVCGDRLGNVMHLVWHYGAM